MHLKRALLILILFLCFSAPCRAQKAVTDHPIKVVASFSVLADMVRQVGGNLVDVQTIIGPEQDAHQYSPSPQDVTKFVDAEIIAINGLKFEGWIGKLIKASNSKAKLLVTTAGVRPHILNMFAEGRNPDTAGQIVPDPHAWQDLRNAKVYINNIAAALTEARPAYAQEIKERAVVYYEKCLALDKKARKAFMKIPYEKHIIVTDHDAFGYFGDSYSIRLLSPMGASTEAEPTPAAIARLINQIKSEHIRALFVEKNEDARLMQQIARETDVAISGTLYADALSQPDGDAPTYLEMMEHNIKAVVRAIQ